MNLVELIITHIQARGERTNTLYGKHGWFILDDKLYKAVADAVIQYEKQNPPNKVEKTVYREARQDTRKSVAEKSDYDEDVVNALVNLGYKRKESIDASRGTSGTIEERVFKALQKLGKP